jgi:predicted transcriptional regulator
MDKPENLAITYHPARSGLEKFWGKLEAELLEIIWENGPMTVKRALFFVRKKRLYAYTTIMTMLNHLVKKGVLRREKEGHAFVYYPVLAKNDFLKIAAIEIIDGLIKDFSAVTGPLLTEKAKSIKKHK